MPKLSVWWVRAALIHMGVGFLFGSLILHHKGVPIFPWTWSLLTPHVEIMIFGWVIQFVMGIGFWILPRFSHEPRYGRVALGWWSFAVLNSGIVLSAFGGWFNHDLLQLAGRVGVMIAVVLFVILVWPRVKPLSVIAAPQSLGDKS